MRKKILFIISIAALVWAVISWAGAPTGGVIMTTVRTNQTILVQPTTAPTAVDSVFICYFAGASTDTTFAALIDTVTTAKLLTGLNPAKQYIVFLLSRQGAGAATALSDKDTVIVYGPEIEQNPNSVLMHSSEQIIRALSWRPTSVLTTFTINGASDADSSGQYIPYKSNSLIVKATQAGDSVNVTLYTFYGQRTMTQTGATVGFTSSQDSLNITAPGTFGKTLTLNLAAPVMYFKLQAYTGNGKNTAIEIYLTRDRY